MVTVIETGGTQHDAVCAGVYVGGRVSSGILQDHPLTCLDLAVTVYGVPHFIC